jgi:3-phosphoshikimate 1-carboxyvinyltransferase
LGYHLLDSGALYRLTALAAQQAGLALTSAAEPALAKLARGLHIRLEGERVWLGGTEVSQAIRSQTIGQGASLVAALPQVRQALLELQRSFRRLPGLVADGRDMGTVVFTDAPLKVFLTANAQARAQRRHQQLAAQGVSVTLDALCAELKARDARDTSRPIAPLRSAQDAQLLDNSDLTVQASVTLVLRWWQSKQVFQQVFETAAKA